MNLANINKKLFKRLIIVIIAFIGIFILLGIIKLIKGTRLSYQKIEDKMISAAEAYFKDSHIEVNLPTGNEIVKVELEDLVANKKIKDVKKYIKKKNVECTGNVSVRLQDGQYIYIPMLDCGDEYKTSSLKDYIINNEQSVSSGDGLYNINNEYIYRGEYVNNYVKFAGQIWRILRIDSEGNIKLLQADTKEKNVWDNRYNVDFKSLVGINNYELSRVNQRLEEIYDSIFTDEDKKYIATKNMCVGKRYITDTSMDGTTECATVLENQKIGLIQINEYLLASIDANCTKIRDGACQNYNYLAEYKNAWWSITPNAASTSEIYEIISGTTNSTSGSHIKIIRPVIYLNSDVIYVNGDGTKNNPYIFK